MEVILTDTPFISDAGKMIAKKAVPAFYLLFSIDPAVAKVRIGVFGKHGLCDLPFLRLLSYDAMG